MLGRWHWNARRVRKFIKFYELLRFNGTTGRTRYKLTPVQCFQFANIFGLARPDGRRLIRTAYIFVPRKFSKTTSAAALAVYDLLFGDNNAQVYIGANSYPQAKICFDEIRAIMRDLAPSERHFRVNRESVTFREPGRDSLIRCLTANAKTQDGLFASLVIMDEYAQARNTANKNGADLKNVLTTSMGPRREPLTVIITTASDVMDGPCYGEIEGVKAVLRGEYENDTVFADLFMPDVDGVTGRPDCAVAFDLSVHDDFSAVTYMLYSPAAKRFYSHTDYYFPEGSLPSHPNAELYRMWHDAGHLKFCKGNRIDVRMIADDILRRSRTLNIIRIVYDQYKSQDLVNILATVGGKSALQPYSQTYGSFNLPVESFEMLVYDTPPRITLNNNPINIYCLTNCVIDEDRLENKKPLKISQYRKIDGTITMLMTLGALYSFER